MTHGRCIYNNKTLLEQGLKHGSHLFTTQREKPKEAPKYSEMLSKGAYVSTETRGARALPGTGEFRYTYGDEDDEGFPTRQQCKSLYQSR